MATLEHIITSGQSLSVGTKGYPTLSLVTEAENARGINVTTGAVESPFTAYGSPERPDVSLTYRVAQHVGISQLVGASTHGFGGASLAQLAKGGSTGKYEEALACVTAARDARVAAGETYAVRAFHWIQGETDQGNASVTRESYRDAMLALFDSYKADIGTVLGAPQTFPFIVSQTATWGHYNTAAKVGLAQLDAARSTPGVYLACPQYQLPYDADEVHLINVGYYRLGEYHARAHNAIKDGVGWLPFAPRGYAVQGTSVTITYDVPSGPLVFDTTLIPAQPNMGFSLTGTTAQIVNVAITAADTVTITTDEPIYEPSAKIGYGVSSGAFAGLGNLRDSDPTLSGYDGSPIPNWAVHSLDPINAVARPLWAYHASDAFMLIDGGLHRLELGN